MDITTKRTKYLEDGIISSVTDEDGRIVMPTLEHAFEQEDGTYQPIIPPGVYKCIRGKHRLDNGVEFETFEVTGVGGHSGLLFHPGNWNKDSKGCILTGTSEVLDEHGAEMITNSRAAFDKFMKMQGDVDSFRLTVIA